MLMLHPEQKPLPVKHYFSNGVYCRELFIPAGMMLTGKIHKTEHISIMLKGRMMVLKDGEPVEVVGPMTEVVKPGIKRVGVAIEDTTWITVHQTDETDVDKLEDMLVTTDYAEVEHILDQQDYLSFEQQFEIDIDAFKQLPYDCMDSAGVELRPSKRHGEGVFASIAFAIGDAVAPAYSGDITSQWSRYMNHSARPNVQLHEGMFVAVESIDKEAEVLVDYRAILRMRL